MGSMQPLPQRGFALNLSWDLDPDCPGRALVDGYKDSTTTINGLHMWICALRVVIENDGAVLSWSGEFDDEIDAVCTLVNGRPETVALPGLEGDWIILAVPHEN